MAKRSNYVLGRSRENNLKYRLIRDGWLVFRMQGSAGGLPSSMVKPIDLVAIKRGRRPLLIQASKRKGDIAAAEKFELRRLARDYGAVPTIAYINGGRWTIEPLAARG
jgi:Holliday junction resolvase